MLALVAIVAVVATGCGSGRPRSFATGPVSESVGAGDRATLGGSGSTFAATMVDEWAGLYRRVAPDVTVRFQATGSGPGIRDQVEGTSDFAVSEAPMTTAEVRTAGWAGAVQVPVVGGAVAAVYHLPGIDDLHLSEDTLARIFAGTVTRWDHPAVKRDNPGVQLPSIAVVPVHRAEPSGTTLMFTRYLATAGRDVWAPGAGMSVDWPVGREAEGSSGVVATVGMTRGSIGYVGLGAAQAAGLQVASLRNPSGRFLPPTPVAVDTALLGASGFDADLTLDVPDRQASAAAYPITAISHLIFRVGVPPDKDAALRHFALWILTEGQRSATRLGFAPLPLPLLVRTLEGLQNGGTKPSR